MVWPKYELSTSAVKKNAELSTQNEFAERGGTREPAAGYWSTRFSVWCKHGDRDGMG